jgi:opacity protein-like surface antigen
MKLRLLSVLAYVSLWTSSATAEPLVMNPSGQGTAAKGYVGLDAGLFWMSDVSPVAGPVSVDIKFKPGFSVNVPFGWDFGNALKAGFEVGYGSSAFDSVVGHAFGYSQGAVTRGDASVVPLMANASYSLKLAQRVRWKLGVGVGAVRESVKFTAFDYPSAKSIIFGKVGGSGEHPLVSFQELDSSKWGFGLEAFTGLTFDVTQSATINIGYRYLQLGSKVSIDEGASERLHGQFVDVGFSVNC